MVFHQRPAANAKWISPGEREFLEAKLKKEISALQPSGKISLLQTFLKLEISVMVVIYFLHNCEAYGCMTFFTSGLKARNFTDLQYGILFAIPYALTALIMVINSWHSDKTQERRGHVAMVYTLSGVSLIVSVLLQDIFGFRMC